ncbi:hypothetical protein [Paenarthrobacter aromaticivorans]|uniref:Uncharacterized protein n=1 Tax=Paenarthrobacter aromaticivorans TaxID=2849150 RepID=A0ABS6I9Q2_9MICC|nr:hypothetical protein [Paenarthrobacter sp. MMS21-TAE1-1]MBU8868443.1 hypothetical protein [Paenarthrobacter sp. MMS21-TAE1-1]
MSVVIVSLIAIVSCVALGLSIGNYVRARKQLTRVTDAARGASEELIDLKRSVEEFEAWAIGYLGEDYPKADAPASNRRHAPSRVYSPSADWTAAFLAMPHALRAEGEEGSLLTHYRWALVMDNTEMAKWYRSELCAFPGADVSAKWWQIQAGDWSSNVRNTLNARAAVSPKVTRDSDSRISAAF